MSKLPLADVIDAADELSFEEQETLLEVVKHRLALVRREQITAEVQEAILEHNEGRSQATTAAALLREIAS